MLSPLKWSSFDCQILSFDSTVALQLLMNNPISAVNRSCYPQIPLSKPRVTLRIDNGTPYTLGADVTRWLLSGDPSVTRRVLFICSVNACENRWRWFAKQQASGQHLNLWRGFAGLAPKAGFLRRARRPEWFVIYDFCDLFCDVIILWCDLFWDKICDL